MSRNFTNGDMLLKPIMYYFRNQNDPLATRFLGDAFMISQRHWTQPIKANNRGPNPDVFWPVLMHLKRKESANKSNHTLCLTL